jgi:hypothetical protein
VEEGLTELFNGHHKHQRARKRERTRPLDPDYYKQSQSSYRYDTRLPSRHLTRTARDMYLAFASPVAAIIRPTAQPQGTSAPQTGMYCHVVVVLMNDSERLRS